MRTRCSLFGETVIVYTLHQEILSLLYVPNISRNRLTRYSWKTNYFAGKSAVYSYDPVGSFELEQFRVAGSSSALMQPFLDSLVLAMLFH